MFSNQWTVERWQRQWDKMTADFLCADWINNPAVARCSRWVWCHQHQSDLSLFQLLHDSSVFVIVNLSLLYFIMFSCFCFFGVRVSLCPNTLTQIIQNWLAGRQIWNNPFRCLFKSLSACELSRQTWSFSIYTRLPQKIFHIASSDTFCRQVGLTERNVCQKPHQQVVWTSFKEKKKVCHVFV